MKDRIISAMKEQKGHVGFYYKNLITGETYGWQQDEKYLAASVIKLPVFLSIAKWVGEGKASWEETMKVRQEDKLPICGALTLFTGEPEVDILTLCKLMISISDNTATNLLIRRFGIPAYEEEFRRMGLKGTRLERPLFDSEGAARGLQNYIVPEEMGMLLEQIYRRTFVDEATSLLIADVLRQQQIMHKIRGILGENVPAAHKTGEADNLTNDVGIVFAKQPFIVCFAGHGTCVPEFEDLIRHVSAQLYEKNNR